MNITREDLPPGWVATWEICGQTAWFHVPASTAIVSGQMSPGYGPGQARQVVETALRNPGVVVAFDTSAGRGAGEAFFEPGAAA